MLFNCVQFLFLFLPILLVVFFRLGRYSHRLGATWLVAGSLFFYGWWNPAYLGLLLSSIIFNYCVGYALASAKNNRSSRRRFLLILGIGGDLVLLGYYKYANFFLQSVNAGLGTTYGFSDIVLPLGISFFTFTQIAFLVDAARGEAKELDFIHYCLFVTYYPHLIAGPVLHHKDMMPQFKRAAIYHPNSQYLNIGLTVFALGLFKKVVIADNIVPYATPVFAAAEQGDVLTFFVAWGGALAYSMQLYFDFSGYSDMAIGLSYMIGVRLPLNFNSPYKAINIADFWRRWHMTLSQFLRDYLYIPLGGNRKGTIRRLINLMITMLLGGLWHGAGWTFVAWGGMHGLLLVMHQLWQWLRLHIFGHDLRDSSTMGRLLGVILTFISVTIGWVFFRAETLSGALMILSGMSGLNGVSLPDAIALRISPLSILLSDWGVIFTPGGGQHFMMNYVWLMVLLPIVFFAPNTQQIMRQFEPALGYKSEVEATSLIWSAHPGWAIVMAIVLSCGLLSLAQPSEFLYFQF